jgi:hypothetical protein
LADADIAKTRASLLRADDNFSPVALFTTAGLDLAQSLSKPARIASRTSSERLLACILVITLAR